MHFCLKLSTSISTSNFFFYFISPTVVTKMYAFTDMRHGQTQRCRKFIGEVDGRKKEVDNLTWLRNKDFHVFCVCHQPCIIRINKGSACTSSIFSRNSASLLFLDPAEK